MEQHLGDADFGVLQLAEEVGLSQRSLHQKVQRVTGKGPGELLRRFRMERAAQLLAQRAGNVTEIAHQVGYSGAHHFSKVFRKTFGLSPSDYVKSIDSKEPHKGGAR
jgi:AraC-like DNA-binding protein